MPNTSVLLFLFHCFTAVLCQGLGSGNDGNLRLCVVEGRGSYKRAGRFCPVLDEEKSGIECVLGNDRLDCLRRMSKGTVDFGVFSPEDLIAAQWADLDVLVAVEMRTRPRPFERNIVAVVNRRIVPEGASTLNAVLRNTTLCHPGLGTEVRPLTDTLAEYLESLVTQRSCDPNMSMAENRISAMAHFFAKACRAGPWVQDKVRDAELKHRYPSLCAACQGPKCATGDLYWGASGALTCLAEGAGDVTWADLDDVIGYFGLKTNSTGFGAPDSFAYLCRDGTWRALREEPCVWLSRPWPVVVAKRKAAAAVSAVAESLTNVSVAVDGHWHGALAALLESAQAQPLVLQPAQVPLDYLARAHGFREAYSQAGCEPPRHITVCTTSLLEKNKCEWLSEAGAVYGVQPPLQCALRGSTGEALRAVREGGCDVALADGDWLVRGIRDYSLSPILHEATPIVEKTSTVVAYVTDEALSKMEDLRGKRAAFPRFDGLAWHSVLRYLATKEKSTCQDISTSYFGDVCAPGIEKYNVSTDVMERLTKSCYKEGDSILEGEVHALRSLVEGRSDVAFISMATHSLYTNGRIQESWANKTKKLVPICPEENKKYCFISWSSIGHVFASKNLKLMRKQEIINVFTHLDQLFGKFYPFHSAMFSMYGLFNHQSDVLFHNNTRILATDTILRTHPYINIPLNFERNLTDVTLDSCIKDFGAKTSPTILVIIISLVVYFLGS